MIKYVLVRILWLIPTIILVSFIIFGLLDIAPGSYVEAMVAGELTEEEAAQLRAQYDLDRSVFYRFGQYMIGLVQGDLGIALSTGNTVWDEFFRRFPNTLIISLGGLFIGSVVAVPLGIFAARRAGSILDTLTTGFTLIGMSMPVFWLGLLLIIWFSFRLQLFPMAGEGTLLHYVLPTITTSILLMATTARQARSSVLDNIRADYLRTARAKGVSERNVIYKHAMGNAWIPVITQMGVNLARVLSGSAVIETVFSFPGVGKLTVDAVVRRDVHLACGCVVLTTIFYVLLLLIVDLLYAFVDPRIKSLYVSGTKRKKKALVAE